MNASAPSFLAVEGSRAHGPRRFGHALDRPAQGRRPRRRRAPLGGLLPPPRRPGPRPPPRHPRRAADEEDVALAAFDSFYRRAERGQFPKLEDRDDLWQLLFVITVRKAIDLTRREARQPGRGARGRSLWEQAELNLELLLGTEPTPEFAALVADECRRLLDRLGDEKLRVGGGLEDGGRDQRRDRRAAGLRRDDRRAQAAAHPRPLDEGGDLMSDATPTEEGNRSPSLGGRVEAVCDRFEAAWKAGRRPPIEDYLGEVPEAARRRYCARCWCWSWPIAARTASGRRRRNISAGSRSTSP